MTTVIYHSADYDGIFCREIARKFIPDANLIGWNFGDPPVRTPLNGEIVVMDLPIDRVFGIKFTKDGYIEWPDGERQPLDQVDWSKFVWIDHHKTSIESHPEIIPGYRIDGVAACRLAWQWFNKDHSSHVALPSNEEYFARIVSEPLAVRLAGEYDIWDKRDWRAETFQYGIRSVAEGADFWEPLLTVGDLGDKAVEEIVETGRPAQIYAVRTDASICHSRTWVMEWEGLKFLCVNSARFNSNFFAARDTIATGHDALLGFCFDGKCWTVSLYHSANRKDLDLSLIAKKYGGGGHAGACGFTCHVLPFIPGSHA